MTQEPGDLPDFNFLMSSRQRRVGRKRTRYSNRPTSGRFFISAAYPREGTMLEKDDRILDCYVMQGQGLKWLGVIYLAGGVNPRALLRYPVSDSASRVLILAGSSPERLSETVAAFFEDLAGQRGLSPLQIRYPLGVSETEFIDGLREAKRRQCPLQPFQNN
jgi:hypothetical protein